MNQRSEETGRIAGTLVIAIKTEGAAFHPPDLDSDWLDQLATRNELGRILRRLSRSVDEALPDEEEGRKLLDLNGNTCGKWVLLAPGDEQDLWYAIGEVPS